MGQSYSEGSRTGRLTKLSRTGYCFKTWEGEMISDGLKTKHLDKNGTAAVANTWNFSIDAKAGCGENTNNIVKQLQTKLEQGEPVTVKYWSPYISFPCRGATWYYVYEVK